MLCAIEWDDNAVATYRANFTTTPVLHRDIAKVSVAEVLELTGLAPGELDILDGSPPCQGFSTSGKRVLDDPRNSLFREYVRLLEGLRPRVFVMENVSGMVKGKMKLVFADILRALKGVGYRVSARVLNAMYFGVPQSRQRMIFVGVRDDLSVEPSHPKAQTRPITASAALRGVKLCEDERQALLAAGRKYAAYRRWGDLAPGQCTAALTGGAGFNACRVHPGRVAPTVRRMDGFVGTYGAMHWDERRRFTVREFMRFGSYPDDFIFPSDFKPAVSQIGNSVPPRFMQAIAEHVRDEILDKVATRESDGAEFPPPGDM